MISKQQIKKATFDDENETFELNLQFASQQIRLNLIPVPAAKKKTTEETEQEKDIQNQVDNDRARYIDAAIVKIMKTRKTETHRVLVEDVMANIKLFKTQPPKIKQRIEALISEDYMKRDEKNKDTYIYIPWGIS